MIGRSNTRRLRLFSDPPERVPLHTVEARLPQGVCRWRGQYTRLSIMQCSGDASDVSFVHGVCDEFNGYREHLQPPTKFAEDPESTVDV